MQVATGSRIGIGDLFARPAEGLRALAATVRRQLLSSNGCVRGSQDTYTREGFHPTPGHYRRFALTPSGLAVGFDIGYVAGVWCGRLVTVVPYSTVRPHLSELGQELVACVRPPRN